MSLELLSLGLDFMGGLFGQSQQKKQHRAQMQQAQRQFDAQMDTSVQRRVKDAKTAGIHPLFAMGASSGASPTISSGSAPQRQPMADAVSRMASTLGVIEQNKASARRDEAQAALFDSERARIEQDMASKGRDSSGVKTFPYPGGPAGNDMVLGPAEYYAPEIPFSKSLGKVAGTQPGVIDIQMPDGQRIEGYSPELGMDEIGQFAFAEQRIPFVMYKRFIKASYAMTTGHYMTDEQFRLWHDNPDKWYGAKSIGDSFKKLYKFTKTPKGYRFQGDTGGDPTR